MTIEGAGSSRAFFVVSQIKHKGSVATARAFEQAMVEFATMFNARI
jgi:hypothetical protein